MSDVWYLFDPDHPARAEQAMQRLHVADGTLVIERGTFADWGFARSEPTFELEEQLAKARARGLAVESDPVAVLIRLSARHLELEAAIQAIDDLDSPAGRDALQVYADFLQTHGDVRGTLASLQLRDVREQPTREWLAEHHAQLFGPLSEDSTLLLGAQLRWMGGWITEVILLGNFDVPLATLLRLPACACVRRLRGAWASVREGLPFCRATLRRLFLERVAWAELSLGELPKLDELILQLRDGVPRGLSFTSERMPKLVLYAKQLADIRAFLDRVSLAPLERFGFRIPSSTRPEELALLAHPSLRGLREIALIGDGPLEGPLLEVLLDAPLLHRVELRDFSQLEVAEPQRVLDAFAEAPGETLVR